MTKSVRVKKIDRASEILDSIPSKYGKDTYTYQEAHKSLLRLSLPELDRLHLLIVQARMNKPLN